MASKPTDELLTTSEAAALSGRSPGALRAAIRDGSLPTAGRTQLGHHWLRRVDVLAFATAHRTRHQPPRETWRQTGSALAVLETATVEELAAYLGLHAGNVRKHLLILEAQGCAERRPDGHWVPTVADRAGAA